jgi:hypothetical protein
MSAGLFRLAAALAVCALPLLASPGGAQAQGFPWPFGDSSKPPVPREPVNRPPPVPAPPPAAQPAPPAAGAGSSAATWSQNRNPICVQLEQRLVQENGRNPREQLPKIETDLKAAQRAMQQSERDLDRSDCYEWFLFTKSLKRTRTCVDLENQMQSAKRQMGELEAQRQSILGASSRSLQDDIVRELARNNCGPGYAQEARKREGGGLSSIWQDDESSGYGGGGNYGSLPFATYRTLCVRLCDGYYFPISFSTLPAHFQRDADACQSKCAAPVELYYHQNPGGAVDQMVALKSQEPYTKLKVAFRYRKEYVQGCSCKQAEYLPQTPAPGTPPDKRAEALPGPAQR